MSPNHPNDLSPVAEKLLREMAGDPKRIEYNTRVLGGAFGDEQISQLDAAYKELYERGLVESAGPIVSFFGQPKRLYRITAAGEEVVKELAA